MRLGIGEVEMKRQMPRGKNRVPSLNGGESTSVAAWVIARCDVLEGWPAFSVEPGVEEAEQGFAI